MAVTAVSLWITSPSIADENTYQGLTAKQWYHKMHTERVTYKHQINRYADKVRTLRRQLREKLTNIGTHSLERSFLCIHSYEGAWNDPNAPYWGGLQMDREFMRTYGPEFYRHWGTADNWPISVQLAVAIRAYISGRGFYPWPNTARYCGLIG